MMLVGRSSLTAEGRAAVELELSLASVSAPARLSCLRAFVVTRRGERYEVIFSSRSAKLS